MEKNRWTVGLRVRAISQIMLDSTYESAVITVQCPTDIVYEPGELTLGTFGHNCMRHAQPRCSGQHNEGYHTGLSLAS